jgi:hypothetical protein
MGKQLVAKESVNMKQSKEDFNLLSPNIASNNE